MRTRALAIDASLTVPRLALSALLLLAAAMLAAAPAHARRWGSDGTSGGATVHLDLAGGSLDVALVPDGGAPLRLGSAGPHRYTFTGATAALVGRSYSVRLRNRTGERLKVVVGVDGLNVYAKETIVGSSDGDTGSILDPWSDRTLAGWQLDDERAQRFVFSPPEWSEGQGITDAKVGLLTVQVYSERPLQRWLERRGAQGEPGGAAGSVGARPAPAEAQAEEARAPSTKTQADAGSAPRAPIGTTSGDEVTSEVRTVAFDAATRYPEAWAVIDYGTARVARVPRPSIEEEERLGLTLEPARDGARIVAVAPGSPAERAGLATADVIVRLDTTFAPSVEQACDILRRKGSRDFAFVRVRRGANELAIKLRT